MKTNTIINKLKKSSQKLLLIFISLLTFTFGWAGNYINTATAATVGNNLPLIANADLDEAINNQLQGVGKQLQGEGQKGIGSTQNKFEDVAKQANQNAEETTKKLEQSTENYLNRVQKTGESAGGKVQNKGQDAAQGAQDAAEGVIDSIKEFFNQ